MPNLLETTFNCLARAGWQAAVLGALVLFICTVLGRRLAPRWRFCLWLLVSVRLALPIAPDAPWSLFRLVDSGNLSGSESGPFSMSGQAPGNARPESPP